VLHKEAPEKTTEWIARTSHELTRGAVNELRGVVRGEGQAGDATQELPKPPQSTEQKPAERAAASGSSPSLVDTKRSESFSRLLGTRVQVEPKQIRISILNPEELQRIEQLLTAGAKAFAPRIEVLE
jgi:hypothetical protein